MAEKKKKNRKEEKQKRAIKEITFKLSIIPLKLYIKVVFK